MQHVNYRYFLAIWFIPTDYFFLINHLLEGIECLFVALFEYFLLSYRKYAMSVFLRGMQPRNGFTAKTIRFVEHFKELQIGWTHNKLRSQGVEEFVDEYLPWIRFDNILIRFGRLVQIEIFLVSFSWLAISHLFQIFLFFLLKQIIFPFINVVQIIILKLTMVLYETFG